MDSLVSQPTTNIFISYETATGLEYARKAKRVFAESGHQAWVWDDDHAATGYPREDIMDHIEACDIFLCICTEASDTSEGQRFESNYALDEIRPPLILTLDPDRIPRVLKAHIYTLVTPTTFTERCRELAHDLDKYPRLSKVIDFSGRGTAF